MTLEDLQNIHGDATLETWHQHPNGGPGSPGSAMSEMKKRTYRKKPEKLRAENELIARTYAEIAVEMLRRHGDPISSGRVAQICRRAEAKIVAYFCGIH